MINAFADQQLHGYRNGHQLLSSSVSLSRLDQDEIDKLSDIAGSLRPGERFDPYLTLYPLPSKEFYVAARTWQDLEAPRAGCVITRSLIFRMADWIGLNSLGFLQSSFTPPTIGERVVAVELSLVQSPMPPVQDSRAIELVEALFLESRKPTVCFDVTDSEVIAIRLLSAMWSNLRMGFSCCTFTLAPRQVGNRDFDLLFAPKSARSRFVDWDGRKVDFSNERPPRHRWSEAIAARIFSDEVPSLQTGDRLGLLSRPEFASEASLRLSLMWNELSEKVDNDPTAVLGMLDIVNTRTELTPETVRSLSGTIVHAARLAEKMFAAEQTWSFLSTLIGKFPQKLPPTSVLRDLEALALGLARRDPEAAIKYLEDASIAVRLPPYILLAAIGDGLASDGELPLAQILQGVSQHISLALTALSSKFLCTLVQGWGTNLTHESFLKDCFSYPDKLLQTRVLRSLSKYLNNTISELLPPLLQNLSEKEYIQAVERIGRHTKFEYRDLEAPIIRHAQTLGVIFKVRNIALEYYSSSGARHFLVKSLTLSAADLNWILSNCEGQIAAAILAAVIQRTGDHDIRAAVAEPNNARLITDILADVGAYPEELAKLIGCGLNLNALSSSQINGIVDAVGNSTRAKLAETVIAYGLTDPSRNYAWTSEMLAKLGGNIKTFQLVQYAISHRSDIRIFAENIQLLNKTPVTLRRQIAAEVDKVSEAIIRRGPQNLGAASYIAWAELISDAGKLSPDAQLRAAIAGFGFALRQRGLPISVVLVATFPLVYQKIPKSKKASSYNPLLALIEISLSFFGEVDRPAAVRQELIDAFINSIWHETDLLLAGIAAGIDQKILKELTQKYSGKGYLNRIVAGVSDLKGLQRKKADKSLERFFN